MTATHAVTLEGEELYLRPASADDAARVYRDWIMSYRGRSRCEREVYETWQRWLIGQLWADVSILYRNGTEIHGWICGEPGLLHYVYVPIELRRHGAAKAMVAALCGAEGEHTHRRMPGLQGFARWQYNPYRIGMVDV